jgi:hypothetical protein
MKTHLRKHAIAAGVVVTLAISACGASTNGATEQANGDCSANPPASGPVAFGDGGVGAPCQKASDCAATCCSCANGSKYLASECVGGSCAEGQTACDDEQKIFSSQGYSLCQ